LRDLINVVHQTLRLVENLLTLLNDAAIKVCLSLDPDRLLVKQLLLLVRPSTSEVSFHIGGLLRHSLLDNFHVRFLLIGNLLGDNFEFFHPGLEVI